MDQRVEDFLNTYGYSDESSKFEEMRFLVFLGMPVNALRAMGVPAKFIDDHKRLVEKTSEDCTLFYIRGRQRQKQLRTKPQTTQRDAGGIARPKSPDVYRTPVSAPADIEFAAVQTTRLGENCCRNPERAKQYSASPRSRLDAKQQQQRRWKPVAESSY